MHAPSNTASKYMPWKTTKLKGETDNFTIIGDVNSPSQKLIELWNKTSVNTIPEQQWEIQTKPYAAEFTFFTSVHSMLRKIISYAGL